MLSPAGLDRNAGELFERREPRGDLRESVVPERAHALLESGTLDLLARRLRRGEGLQPLAHRQQLVDADPALEAGVAAPRAAALAVEDRSVRGGSGLGRESRLD